MVGDDKNRRLRRKLIDNLARSGIESLIDFANGVAELRRPRWIMEKMLLVHVLPEVMLDGVDGHENKHHHVLGMLLQEIKGRLGPLLVNLFHLREDLIPPFVGRHCAQKSDIELDSAKVLDQ